MAKQSGCNLVLLPGLHGTGELFGDFVRTLPADILPYVISYPTQEVLTLSGHAEFVFNRLPGSFVMLAESFSGLIALSLLSEYQVPAQAVIFCAAFGRPPRRVLLSVLRSFPRLGLVLRLAPGRVIGALCAGNQNNARVVTVLRRALSRVGEDVIANRFRLLAEEHVFKSEFRVPCYYFQAKHDRLVPSRHVQWFQERFPDFTVERIDGPHFLLQTRAEECAKRVANITRHLRHVGDTGPA